jgi:signal peptidase I
MASPPETVDPSPIEDAPTPEPTDDANAWGAAFELPVLLIGAVIVALLIKAFLFQAFFIPSASMEPTLIGPGDRIIVNKLPYYLHDPLRGDVIVFANPNGRPVNRGPIGAFVHWLGQGLGFTSATEASCGDTDPDEDFVKRVVAVGGDIVEGRNGAVYVNGSRLAEPYLPVGLRTQPFPLRTVPPGSLFVMGDNREDSCDSRFALGLVPVDHVVGKAAAIIWPPSRLGAIA